MAGISVVGLGKGEFTSRAGEVVGGGVAVESFNNFLKKVRSKNHGLQLLLAIPLLAHEALKTYLPSPDKGLVLLGLLQKAFFRIPVVRD